MPIKIERIVDVCVKIEATPSRGCADKDLGGRPRSDYQFQKGPTFQLQNGAQFSLNLDNNPT